MASPSSLSRRGLAALALSISLASGCTNSDSGTASATASPAPVATLRPQRTAAPPAVRTAAPERTAVPSSATARPAATEAPAPVATRTPAAPTAAPGPAIYSASASSEVVHAGGSVLWTVRTSPDVVSVVASTPVYSFAMNKSAPGLFQLTFGIPANAPPLFHGSYTLSIVGTDAAGRTASSSIPMRFE